MSNLQILLEEQDTLIDREQEKEQYEELLAEIQELKIIQDDLKNLIDDQRPNLEDLVEDITFVDTNVEVGLKNLQIARTLNTQYLPIVLGVVAGSLLGGPVGAVAGLKAGAAVGVAVGSGVLGGSIGYGLQK
jgi:hypothetical protein